MLVKSGDDFAISYATHIKSEGFQRFSIAHELGHFFLPGHPEALFAKSDSHSSMAGFAAGDPIELEADHFAACLLMPRTLFTSLMDKNKDGMDAVVALSESCKTSRIATAIRYAELSKANVAIVVSSGTTIDYCFMSDSLQKFKGLRWIRKGRALPQTSATMAMRKRTGAIDNGDSDSDQSDTTIWFDSERETALVEEVIGLGEYGRTLTILTVEEEEEDEEDSAGRFGEPRFRR